MNQCRNEAGMVSHIDRQQQETRFLVHIPSVLHRKEWFGAGRRFEVESTLIPYSRAVPMKMGVSAVRLKQPQLLVSYTISIRQKYLGLTTYILYVTFEQHLS